MTIQTNHGDTCVPATNLGLRKVVPALEMPETIMRVVDGVNALVDFAQHDYKGWISHEPGGAIVTALDPVTTLPDPVRAVKLPEFARLPVVIGGYTTGTVTGGTATFTLNNVHAMAPVYTLWTEDTPTVTNSQGLAYASGQYVVCVRDQASWKWFPLSGAIVSGAATVSWAKFTSNPTNATSGSAQTFATPLTCTDYTGVTTGSAVTLKTPIKQGRWTALFSGDVVAYVTSGGANVILTDCYDDPVNTVRMITDSNVPNGWTDVTTSASLGGSFPMASTSPVTTPTVTAGDTHNHPVTCANPIGNVCFSTPPGTISNASGSISGITITVTPTTTCFTLTPCPTGCAVYTPTICTCITCQGIITIGAQTLTMNAATVTPAANAIATSGAFVTSGPDNGVSNAILKPNSFAVRFIQRTT